MKLRAIRECPQGQQPGEVFEVTPEVGQVLIDHLAAERAPEDTPVSPPPKRKRTYGRRDMEAEP